MTPTDRFRNAVVGRLRARRWMLDVARSTTTARRARRTLERLRVGLLVRSEGGADAALQRIVDEAINEATNEPGTGEPS